MNEKNPEDRGDYKSIRAAILRVLESRGKKARFITELSAVLRGSVATEALARGLAGLEAEGMVMVRDHFCADPHLANVDLRVAALVPENGGADAQLSAIRAIDEAWDKWLTEYLANHRCE